MTVTAEQAKAMLDDRAPTTHLINEAYEGGLLVELDIEARHHANSVQQLAATVVELWERLATVEAERDKWCRIYAQAETERNAFEAAIDKVLALHAKTTEEMLDHKCVNEVCEHEDECPSVLVDVCRCCTEIAQQVSDEYWPASMDEITWPCPTVAALTQGGEG